MARWPYQRIDLRRLSAGAAAAEVSADPRQPAKHEQYVRCLVAPLAVGLSVAQAVITVAALHLYGLWLTATMIPIGGFAMLFVIAGGVNPAWAWLRNRFAPGAQRWLPRPFSRPELVHLFAAMLVTSGIASYGLSQQLVPLIATPWNPDWNTPQRGWSTTLHARLNADLYITDPAAIRPFYEGITRDESGRPIDPPRPSAGATEWVSYHAKIARLVPWSAWVRPLLAWSVMIGAAYLLFYSLTYLVLDQWTHGEKLIFPLSRLGEAMLPSGENESRGGAKRPSLLPTCLRGMAFWLGFAVSFGTQSFNALAPLRLHIPLGATNGTVNSYLADSSLKGLVGSNNQGVMFLVIFTSIGLAFLLSTEITFSIWFYFVLSKLLLLLAVWYGYGANLNDFPFDWIGVSNPITSQAGGAVLFLSALVLWRSARDHLAPGRGLSTRERLRNAWPVLGVLISCSLLIAWLRWNSVPTLWAGVYVAVTAMLSLGMMRFVAEAGVYWFQLTTGFFHLHRMFALGRYLAGPVIAPLIPINSVLFLDVKCLLAGHLITASWLNRDQRDETGQPIRQGRGAYHATIVMSIAAAVVASVLATIYIAYWRGGYQGQAWVFSNGPQHFIDSSLSAARSTPTLETGNALCFFLGIAWCALSMWLRRTLFFFPHPIGYIMLANQMIPYLWFSCLIGWACKNIVVRYGGKNTFDKVRDGFIGLIFGELLAIAAWSFYALVMNEPVGVLDLNRYGA